MAAPPIGPGRADAIVHDSEKHLVFDDHGHLNPGGRRVASHIAQRFPQRRQQLAGDPEGLTNRQIGERMYLAEKTVKNYVSNLLSKMGLSRRTEAAAYAARMAERHSRDRRV